MSSNSNNSSSSSGNSSGGGGGESDPLYRDFRNFLIAMWAFLGLPRPTPLQLDMAYRLQYGPKRDLLKAFRGASKSWVTGAYSLWRMYRDPTLLILVVSASGPRAANFTTFCLSVIKQWDTLRFLRPRRGQRESTLGFDVGPVYNKPDQQPSFQAKGITGQIAGSRADIIIPDDIEIPRNSDTEPKREKLRDAVREFDAVVRPDGPGEIKFLGTPQSESSVYNVLLERGYDSRIWPVRYPALADLETSWGVQIAPSIRNAVKQDPSLAGKSVEPTRFSDEDLAARRLSYGALGFALQFMLDTTAGDNNRFPLRLMDLIVADCQDAEVGPDRLVWAGSSEYSVQDINHYGLAGDRLQAPMTTQPALVPWQYSILSVDPSGRGSDETAYATIRFLNGRLFVTDFGGIPGGYEDEVLQKLADIAKKQKVNMVIGEDNFGQGMFAQLLKAKLGGYCPVDTVRVTVQKERRIIAALEPVMSAHRLVVDRSALERDYRVFSQSGLEDDRQEVIGEEGKRHYSLSFQLSRVTYERNCLPHDDRLDALAQGVQFFEERMDIETGLLEIASDQRRIEFDVEQFLEGVMEATRNGDPGTGHIVLGSPWSAADRHERSEKVSRYNLLSGS